MKIADITYYDGAREKVCRLGVAELFLELQDIIFSTHISLLEEKDANGAAHIRKLIDETFAQKGGWNKITTGGMDWQKKLRYNQTFLVRMGVELQVSARSDLLVRDIVHLRNSIDQGEIEVGVIVVPSMKLQAFLPDRTPSIRDAKRYIEEEFREAMNYPLVLVAIEHDGPGEALPKQARKS